MFAFPYLVEILTPKRIDSADTMDKITLFAERYHRIFDLNLGISIPDNPMGQPRFSLLEMIERAQLPVRPEATVMNLNTFHTKEELKGKLKKAAAMGLKYLLVVRGDGGPNLPKLDPKSIGGARNVATSPDLIRYINGEHGAKFVTGCAYNQYSALPFELDRLRDKIEAGAKFVITQPVIGNDPNVESIFGFGIPVVIEAWMSKNLELLFKSVRKPQDQRAQGYDPIDNLRTLHAAYPDSCAYLSMLGFKKQWTGVLPRL
jgi:methylenetetrahydrofolate reductase (NADPH)